jgi:competence ComEA-like helix-hairpin-helix protein
VDMSSPTDHTSSLIPAVIAGVILSAVTRSRSPPKSLAKAKNKTSRDSAGPILRKTVQASVVARHGEIFSLEIHCPHYGGARVIRYEWNMTRRILLLMLIGGSMLVPSSAQPPTTLPDGEGKTLVQKTCSKCHGVVGIVRARNSKEAWAEIVDDMISRGADATDEEIELIINYLAKNFGRDKPPAAPLPKVKVNQAKPEELSAGMFVPKETAEAIVDYREKNGPFKKWQDLEKVPGVDMKKVERDKDRYDFEEK